MSHKLVNQFSSVGRSVCYKCEKTVYPTEKIGPVNQAIFHKNCFRCHNCGISLNLNSYCANPVDGEDRNVYCSSHKPQLKKTEIDTRAVSMRTALSAQTFYNQRKDKDSDIHRKTSLDAKAISIQQAVNFTKRRNEETESKETARNQIPTVELQSVSIQGAVQAQKLRKNKKGTYSRHHYVPQMLQQHKKQVRAAQENLELRHRAEEDRLFQILQEERQVKETELQKEMQQAWEVRLQELVRRQAPEKEKEDVKKTIRFKEQEQRQVMETQIQEMAQEKTAELVARQSKEMLQMLAKKRLEMENELEQIEEQQRPKEPDPVPKIPKQRPILNQQELLSVDSASESGSSRNSSSRNDTEEVDLPGMLSFIPDRIPSPHPPSQPKRSLYTDPDIFKQLDEHVISIAEAEYPTFTELADQLTQTCMSDLEKVRAIFRWITVKDLSNMTIDLANPDTPLGLLRGIHFGTETYYVLFMRLCSYAGIHAAEIRGYSKSVGYDPGQQFRNAHKFKNTWNAVFVDGDWRLVQCNWAARKFVFCQSTGERSPTALTEQHDHLRYTYDEHYFLTDPKDFIYEFYPFEPKWQLLEVPISLTEFEELPFVRSDFFHFGMQFPIGTKATLEANELGGTKLEICLKDPTLPLVCHYQFRCADTGSIFYQGAKLDRFVFLTVPTAGTYLFDVHVPNKRAYFLDIFAAVAEPQYLMQGYQMRLKCISKFKIVSPNLQKRMTPLPQSSSTSGEWGPAKAMRHFLIKPLTHAAAVVTFDSAGSSDRELAMEFWIPNELNTSSYSFSALLHKNGLTPQVLSRFLKVQWERNVLLVRLKPPESGQYALELFLERDSMQKTHVCKYLIKCSNVPHNLVSLSKVSIDEFKVKSGPNAAAIKKFGISHQSDAKFKAIIDTPKVTLHFNLKDDLDLIVTVSRLPVDSRQGAAVEDHSDNAEVRTIDQVAAIVVQFVCDGKYNVHLMAKRSKDSSFELCYSFKFDVQLATAVKL